MLFSGDEADAQIRSVTLTEQCNDSTDLCPGAACAACAEIELWAPHDVVQLQAGEEFALSRIDTDLGNEEPVGIFIAEQPTKASANVYRLDAYDRTIRLDQDFSPWLRDHQADFPMTIPDIVAAACEVCGVELTAGAVDGLPNADYQVQAFYSDSITGRQIIQWAGEAFCRFARMTADGRLEFAWYVARGYEMIGPSAALRPGYVRLADRILGTAQRELYRVQFQQQAYLQGTLSYEQYSTALVEKVQIRQSDTDVGVVYPPDATGTNALVLQGNLLLTANSQAQLEPVAQAIWQELTFGAPVPGPNNMLVRMAGEVLAAAPDGALYMVKSSAISYTPLKVSVLATGGILPRPGDVITVTDAYGRQMVTYVMRRTISGQKVTLESTGNARRDGSTATNRAKISNTSGRLFELQIGIDGLRATAIDLQGKQAELTLTVDGLASTVEANYDALKDYADDAANTARDQAIQSAVDQAEAAFGQELQLYPTKVEMDSAIRQSAGEISSQVNMTLEGYATKEYTDTAEQDAKDFASSAAQDALDQANADTDGKLALYPTTVEMNSAITQTASQITSQVSQTLTQYSTTSESQAYADGVAGDAETAAKQYADQAAGQAEDAANAATDNKLKNYRTTSQMYSAIQQSASEILSTVSNTYTTEVQAASAGRNLVSNTAFIGYDPQDSAATVQDGVLTIKPVDSLKRLEFPLDFTPYGLGEIKKISSKNHVTISGEYRIDKEIYYNGSVSSPNYVVLEITTESGAPVELKAPATPILANVTSGWVSFSEWYNPSLGNIVSARLIVVCERAYRGSISWRNLKVEMGKTATPWSAAPEDVVLQIGYSEELSQQVSDVFDEKLTFYPTSVEMNSAIKQSADSIQLTVDKTLTGYVTKDDITLYPTTIQMNSAIEQSSNQIKLSVEQTLTGYSTTSQMQAAIDLAVSGINLSVSNGSESSTLTLKHGSTTLSSAQITFSGLVNFVTQSDLSTAGQTTINGGNIKTGVIDSMSGYTHLDLATGNFRVGVSATDRVEMTPEGIVWYAGNSVYGQLAHGRIRVEDTRMWITSDSRYQMLGWLHEASGDYQCLEVEETDNAVSVPNRLNVGGVCSVRTLTAWDGKDRVVQTDHWGNRAIAAMESPEPMFFDAGSGVVDETGVCYIEINPIYGETTSATVERRWYVTPTSDGALWVDKQPWGAIVHGAPGMTFDWMVGSIQRGYEGIYAEVNTDNYPNVHYKPGDGLNDAVLRGVFDPMADAVTDYLDETDYNAILREALTA